MVRLSRTRKESINALHRAISSIWHMIHKEHRRFDSISLSDVSHFFRISTLPPALIKPYVLSESEPTYASAAELREVLSYKARYKGGHRPIKNDVQHHNLQQTEQTQANSERTLFNVSYYDAVEEINRLCEVLTTAGFKHYGTQVVIREDGYSIQLEIIHNQK